MATIFTKPGQLSLCLLVLILFGQNAKAQSGLAVEDCITLKPGGLNAKDTYINSAINYHQAREETVMGLAWTFSGIDGVGRSLMQFDLSSIPTNVVITRARLGLYYNPVANAVGHSTQSGSNACYLRRIIDPWVDSTTIWTNQPGYTTQNQVLLPMSLSVSQDYPNIDVTNLVVDMLANPGSSFGFMLSLQTEIKYRSLLFSSGDHRDSFRWPELEVCYNTLTQAGSPVEKSIVVDLWPNPAADFINLSINAPSASNLKIGLYDLAGRQITDEISGRYSPGQAAIQIPTVGKVAAGTYIVKISVGETTTQKRVVLRR